MGGPTFSTHTHAHIRFTTDSKSDYCKCALQNSHVVLDELLYFVVCEYALAVCDGAFFKLVVESWWAEKDDSPANQRLGNVKAVLLQLHC